MRSQTFGNGNGNERIIPNFWEREWDVGTPGNGREREFLLTPGTPLTDKIRKVVFDVLPKMSQGKEEEKEVATETGQDLFG